MHLNYYFLNPLTNQLNQKLNGFTLVECYSQNKNELIFGYSKNSQEFYIKAIFNGSFSLISFPKEPKRARKNSIDLFDPLRNSTVKNIYSFQNERSFCIEFNDGYSLVFKLHGNRSNIILFQNDNYHSLFRNNLISDKNLIKAELHRKIDQSNQALIDSDFDLKKIYPTFGKKIIRLIQTSSYLDSDDNGKIVLLNETLDQLNHPTYYIYSNKGLPYLSLLDENIEALFSSTNPIESCNYLANNYISQYYLQSEKNEVISTLQKVITKTKNYITKSNSKLELLKKGVKYEELANILMANLHVKNKNQKKILLYDFYRNEEICIKINSLLSIQANAENYYRKNKNQQLEKDNLLENISAKEIELKNAESDLNKIQSINDLKTFRKQYGAKTKSSIKTSPIILPFNELEIDGFRIYIGKNAKSNDQLISKHTSKNDLWLHARGVSGSHVIIKDAKNGQFPKALIEKIASLAAWHSKGQNDTLCPVIYTPRKYIRKPKGALPGQVIVEKEEVILVKPCRNVQ